MERYGINVEGGGKENARARDREGTKESERESKQVRLCRVRDSTVGGDVGGGAEMEEWGKEGE